MPDIKTIEKWNNIIKNNKLICKKCKLEKPLDLFNIRNHKGFRTWRSCCKECQNNKFNIQHKERVLNNGLEWNIRETIRRITQRSNISKKLMDVDLEFLIDLYNKQKGICVYSGRKMSFEVNSPERLSLERKDSNLGYIKTNVVWCCNQANKMKLELTIDEWKEWIKDIHNNII